MYNLKGCFLHKGHIFLVPGVSAGQQFESECFCRVSCGGINRGASRWHRQLKEAIFSSWELQDRMTTLETLLHMCILHPHPRMQHREDAYLIPVPSLTGLDSLLRRRRHTRATNTGMCDNMPKCSVCHNTRALCSIWWVFPTRLCLCVCGRCKLLN